MKYVPGALDTSRPFPLRTPDVTSLINVYLTQFVDSDVTSGVLLRGKVGVGLLCYVAVS